MQRALFPGSFDPITLGHLDVVERALPFFDEIVIAAGVNIDKKYMFPVELRMQFLEQTFAEHEKIKVTSYEGLTVDYCKKIDAHAILRGLRNPADFEFEKAVAQINRKLSGMETLFLLTDVNMSYISSSMVRDIIANNGDYSSLVPNAVKF